MKIKNQILIFIEQKYGLVHPITFELLSKAQELNFNNDYTIDGVILGKHDIELDDVCQYSFDKIYHIQGNNFDVPDEIAYRNEIVDLMTKISPRIFLIGATTFGRSLAPRLAAALETGLTADCTELKLDGDNLIQIRPAFSGNILAHIKCDKFPQMATIRYKEFAPAKKDITKNTEVVLVKSKTNRNVLEYKEISKNEIDITEYEVIVSGGKGLKKAEDMKLLKELADLLGGQIAASRAIVDQGYISKDYQVGYSGHRVKPKLYIACGISGAPQHLAGMKESEKIIAINSDATAPIFNIADYGIVGDLYVVVPMLIDKYKKAGVCS